MDNFHNDQFILKIVEKSTYNVSCHVDTGFKSLTGDTEKD